MLKKIKNFIPLKRIVFYLLITGCFPAFFTFYYFYSKKCKLNQWELAVERIHNAAVVQAKKQAVNQKIRRFYANSESLYLDRQLEKIRFLKKEKEALEQMLRSRTFTGNEAAELRYTFLTGEENRLLFTEFSSQKGEGIIETLLLLAHPVEIDSFDLKDILSYVEGTHSKQPQLLITDFKIARKKKPTTDEVFELNLKILKREYLE
jgi:hypothetical protein